MIKKETITINNKKFVKTYSDTYMIHKIGTDEIYIEAVDLPTSKFEYEETDELLPKEEL